MLPRAPEKFYRMVDNNFVVTVLKARLNETEYETIKNEYMDSADMRMVLTILNLKNDNPIEDIFLVTEETETSNDNKLFKKIPAICSHLRIMTINIQQLMDKLDGIEIEIK